MEIQANRNHLPRFSASPPPSLGLPAITICLCSLLHPGCANTSFNTMAPPKTYTSSQEEPPSALSTTSMDIFM